MEKKQRETERLERPKQKPRRESGKPTITIGDFLKQKEAKAS